MTNSKSTFETACRWKNDTCSDCNALNPFSTQTYCQAAITLYYASGNILCPKCSDGYLKLSKAKKYECENCSHNIGYDIVLDLLLNSNTQ
ncbi:MAG: hypothetical protein FWG10_10580 [Eubacteriaceae bacterium]|nr:hypothetical protein [Eubacteriaceae bacterium]